MRDPNDGRAMTSCEEVSVYFRPEVRTHLRHGTIFDWDIGRMKEMLVRGGDNVGLGCGRPLTFSGYNWRRTNICSLYFKVDKPQASNHEQLLRSPRTWIKDNS